MNATKSRKPLHIKRNGTRWVLFYVNKDRYMFTPLAYARTMRELCDSKTVELLKEVISERDGRQA